MHCMHGISVRTNAQVPGHYRPRHILHQIYKGKSANSLLCDWSVEWQGSSYTYTGPLRVSTMSSWDSVPLLVRANDDSVPLGVVRPSSRQKMRLLS